MNCTNRATVPECVLTEPNTTSVNASLFAQYDTLFGDTSRSRHNQGTVYIAQQDPEEVKKN